MLTSTTALSADLRTYFAKKLLVIAKRTCVLRQFANMEPLPANSSKTISFTQYAKLTPVAGVLSEGITPPENVIASSAITATVDQLGDYVVLTDLAELTVEHPVAQKITEILGAQASESIDNRILTVLLAGTNVQYANGKASRVLTAATDVVTSTELRKLRTSLRRSSARGIDGKWYVLVVDPEVESDITADAEFKEVQYRHPDSVFTGEIGRWQGFVIVTSDNIPALAGAGASGANIHTSFAFGADAYAITDLQSLQFYMQGPGGLSDPLEQRRTMGWKVAFKAVILNQSFMRRLESGSNFG